MWHRRVKPAPLDWQLVDILKRDLDWHNAELHKAAEEIERLRVQIRQLETERDQWQRMANRD